MLTRRYFGTDGVRGVAGTHPMTAEFALRLGMAVAETVRPESGPPHVLIGMDTRRSGLMLAHAAASGLLARGAHVTWLGVLPTPGVSFLTNALGADAGLMVSASHNPFADNGLKLFDRNGEKLSDELEADIEALIDALGADGNAGLENVVGEHVGSMTISRPWDGNGTPNGAEQSVLNLYVKHLLDNAPYLDGMRVVVDCANGASHLIAPQLFAKLGARLEVVNAEPDGVNINVACGSTHPEALAAHVLAGGFEVGVTFDGDADRALLIDSRGRVVTGDHMLAITALSRGEKALVATQMSNLGTETYLRERGVTMHRAKVGDRYVFEELKRHDLALGGEQSGHLLFLDKAPTGDGMLTALMALAAVRKSGKPLEAWMDDIPVYPQVLRNVRVTAGSRDHVAAHPEVAAAVVAAEAELGANGRVLLRPSGTEPLVRVMVEGSDLAEVERLAADVVAAVEAAARS